MVDVGTVGILAQAATGFFVLLAGLVALASASPRRHTVSFSLFLILWGGFLLAGNIAHLNLVAGDLVQSEQLLLLQAVLQGIAYLPLVVFTLSYPPSRRVDLGRWPILAALLAPALVLLAVVVVDPGLFHEGFSVTADGVQGSWGPASAAVFALFILAVYAVIVRLLLVHERSTKKLERRQALYVLLGFALFVGFESSQNTLMYADVLASGPEQAFLPVVVAVTSALGIGVLVWAARHLLRGARPLGGFERRLAVGCLAGSMGLGLVSGASFTWAVLPEFGAEAVWRVGTVALVMSAVVRFEPSEPQHSLPTLVGVLGWFGVGAAALLTMHLGLSAVLGSPMQAFVALQLGLVACAGLVAWRRPDIVGELLRQVRRRRSSVGQARRNLELYEAALLSDSPERLLGDLRDRMSITEAEHHIMRHLTDPHTVSPMPSRSSLGSGDVLDDRYEIQTLLGDGTSSRVYQARDLDEDRAVALKVLNPACGGSAEDLRRFLYECRALLRMRHPHILDAYALGHVDGHPYLSFELVEGGTLASRLDEDGLERGQACAIVGGVLAGLEHLHGQGLVHRDLKPTNILVDEDGRAKIGDLGLADPWDPERTQRLRPEGGQLREGTPAYMSPEALMGHPPAPTCDVYAVGAILVEALSGRHYLGLEGAPYGTVKRATIESPPSLQRVDPELVPVCRRALAKDPSRRYGSAAEMREEILEVFEQAADGTETPSSEITPPETVRGLGDRWELGSAEATPEEY